MDTPENDDAHNRNRPLDLNVPCIETGSSNLKIISHSSALRSMLRNPNKSIVQQQLVNLKVVPRNKLKPESIIKELKQEYVTLKCSPLNTLDYFVKLEQRGSPILVGAIDLNNQR